MADMFHVGSYLVSPTCLEYTLYKSCVAEPFYHAPVGYRMFSHRWVVIDCHYAAVFLRACYIAFNRSLVCIEVTPHQGGVFTFSGVVEKLLGQHHLSRLVFCNQQ